MANPTRSSVLSIILESVEGTLEDETAGSFVPLREGFALTNELETIDTDELKGGIGASASISVGENPTANWSAYLRHSGTEGVEPEYGPVIESCMGNKEVNGTEYNTVAASSTTVVKVDTGEGVNFSEGHAILIKDGTNSYSIRNVESVSTDDLNVNFTLDNAPAVSIDLGKAIFYSPASTGHPTYSVHHYQDATNAAFKQAIAGSRTVNLTMDLPTRDLATLTADIAGLTYYYDHIKIDATNNLLDMTDDGGTIQATIESKVFQTPIALAEEIASKATAASVGSGDDVISCSYSSSDGKYTLSSDGSTFELLWNTGAGTATSIGTTMGFLVAADDTGAVTYTSDAAIAFNPSVTPAYDGEDQVVVKNAEILIGEQADNGCRKATNVSFTIATPKTDVKSICAENAVDSTFIGERTATMTSTIILEKYEAELLNKSLNNTTTKIMANVGPKDGSGNWQAGKTINIYMKNAKIKTSVTEEDSYYTLTVEATGFINSSTDKDIYINFL